jgi:hypothetical protein
MVSDDPCGTGSGSFKLKPAAKNWGNRVAWEMGMAMSRVFGRRQKSFGSESVLLGAAKRHPRTLSGPGQGRERPVRNFMKQFEVQSWG